MGVAMLAFTKTKSVLFALILAAVSAAAQPAMAQELQKYEVTGFRDAKFGMTEAEVRATIIKSFGLKTSDIATTTNPVEGTTVLTVKVASLDPAPGTARVAYILGSKTKKLIQVNVVWGTTIDPQVKPERIVAGANQLRTLFLSAGYVPETVVSNIPSGSGAITVFQGEDADKHMTVLRLVTSSEASARQKQQRKGNAPDTAVVLLLSYVQDPRNPDVYRLKKGQF